MDSAANLVESWPLADQDELRDALLTAYADPRRAYHDRRHLSEVLARIYELAETTACDHLSVVLAAWFHDGVYDGQPGAEERSAIWAEQALKATKMAPGAVAEVARLVRLTERHDPEDHDGNGCVLSDSDLAILAAPAPRYAEYVAQVRAEYSHYPDEVFRAGRATILHSLLDKPTLFHTAHAIKNWESLARANVLAELNR